MGEASKLDNDLASPEFLEGVEQEFWSLPERTGDLVYITLFAPDGRSFMARFDCSSYWTEPIECLFVDPRSRMVDSRFWPDGDQTYEGWIKFRSDPGFICWDQDRGGIAHHPDWKALKAWQKESNPIVSYLTFLRRLLHLKPNGYNRMK